MVHSVNFAEVAGKAVEGKDVGGNRVDLLGRPPFPPAVNRE